MIDGRNPRWLTFLERKMGWLAVPNLAILLVTLQGLGFLMVALDPIWVGRLALIPERVAAGEYHRLLTFLSLPFTHSPFWLIFVLWFLYFIVNTIENEWGAFKTTLYVLISWWVTIAFSFAFNYAILDIRHFESTLFLAAAALYPEMEVRLFFAIPAKIKWLAWLTLAFVALEFVRGSWLDRFFLLAIYSNCLIFFGPALLGRVHQSIRRARFRRKMR